MSASHELGRRAEAAATEYLRQTGWTVLAANWRFRHREIDLIVQRGGVVAFVEVKCRSGSRFGAPVEAVTAAKRRFLASAAGAWIAATRTRCATFRFDLCAVSTDAAGMLQIEHLEDAWRL